MIASEPRYETPWKVVDQEWETAWGSIVKTAAIFTDWDDAQLKGPLPVVSSVIRAVAKDKDPNALWVSRGNAEFIVRACNAHDDLLLAAKEAAIVIAQTAKAAGSDPMKGTCLPRLMNAIAKATGAQP